MSMEINGTSGRPPVDTPESAKSSSAQAENNSQASSQATVPGGVADTFSLTNKASQLQQLEAQIASLPVVDTQRVEDVQHAMATGTLQVEPARVAEKMLAFEVGLDNPAPSKA